MPDTAWHDVCVPRGCHGHGLGGSLQIPGEASIPATMHHPKNLTRACGVKVWAGGHAVWRRGESYRTTPDISALGPGEQSCGRAGLFHVHGCSELS